MISPVMYSSASDEWATPQDLFDRLNAKCGPFDLDVCATAENAKCKEFYTRKDNGILQPWGGKIWCNPPYGESEDICKRVCFKKRCAKRGWHRVEYYHGCGEWVQRAELETRTGDSDLVVMLLPARTETQWFQDFVIPYAEIEFLRGRVKFGGHKNSAPFPSCVAVFRRK